MLPQGVVTLLESQLKQMARDKSDKYVFGFVDYSRFGSWVDNFAEHKANNDAATFLVLDKPGSKYFVVDGIDKLDAELTKVSATSGNAGALWTHHCAPPFVPIARPEAAREKSGAF